MWSIGCREAREQRLSLRTTSRPKTCAFPCAHMMRARKVTVIRYRARAKARDVPLQLPPP